MKLPNVEDIYPLSPMQEGMLFHSLYNPDSGAYFIQMGCILRGTLVTSAFRKAWEEVIQRHAILRTALLWDGLKKPVQVVRKSVEFPWHEEDWQELPESTREKKWEDFLQQDRKRGFDFQQPPLLRLALIRTGEDSHYFAWSFHHVLLDGWCRQIVIQEVFKLYEAYCRGRELKLGRPQPYREYIAWLLKQDEKKAETFWREELSGFTEPTLLGIEQAKPGLDEDDTDHEVITSRVGQELTQCLERLARSQQVTLNTIMQGAWGIVLSRYSGMTDVVFGATVSGREAQVPGIDTMMGIFINTLPVRVRVRNQDTVGEYLKQLQRRMAATRDYEYCPLVKVRGWSELLPGVPLFESFVVFENYPVDSAAQRQAGASMKFEDMRTFETNTFPLVLAVIPGREIMLSSSFSPRIFSRENVERLMQHFSAMLEKMAAGAEQPIGRLSLLRQSERQQLVEEWNQTRREYPRRCVHELFEQQVEKTPGASAVECAGEQLTYGELNDRANRLAHYLAGLGIGPEVRVGICLERGTSFLVGILGILKAGGAYLPVDPSFPAELLETMLSDAQVSIILTQESLRNVVSSAAPFWMQVVSLDADWAQIADQSADNPQVELRPDNLAYVMYTSGSTGRPKGISIVHEAIVRLVLNTKYVQLNAADRVAQIATTSFDAATFEIWGALLNGGSVVVLDRETTLNPVKLEHAIRSRQISVVFLTTALFNQIARESKEAFRNLRYLLFGGEAVDPQWVAAVLNEQKPEHFLHVYGPTEMTTYTTFYEIREVKAGAVTVPIGGPISNTEVYVLDEEMEILPVGITGELYAGGVGLARGYLNSPELTAEKFVPNPFSRNGGERFYRTGDRVRWRPDGALEFVGRVDHQIKLRGYRIELGDIEAALMKLSRVENAVVLMREDRPGEKQLAAYLAVGEAAQSEGLEEKFKDALRQKLPEYMVPADIVVMGSLPLTRNGKIDRKALPAPSADKAVNQGTHVMARTPIEELIAPIWEEVLGVHRIGVTDNFFALGGHSLLATQVVVRMNNVFRLDIPLRTVFENPTIAELARRIEEFLAGEKREDAPPIERVSREHFIPLSYAQQRLWFIHELDPATSAYNVPAAVRICGKLDVNALEQTFSELVRRHEPLRTRFSLVNGEPRQVIEETSDFEIQKVDLTAAPPEEREEQAKSLAREEARQPFDLEHGPVLRVKLLRLSDGDHVLLLTMHHIVCDGWSLGILLREVSALYGAFSAELSSPLKALPVQYADYSAWQRRWLHGPVMDQQLGYWKRQLAGVAALELPTDFPRPAVQTQQGSRMKIELPSDLSGKLRSFARSRGATLYMTLLAAFEVLLHRYTGQENFAIGAPIAGRKHAETEGLIGFFVNTLVLRSSVSVDLKFSELVQKVKETTLDAYAHQDVPFEKLVEELQPARHTGRTPLFQAVFVLQNAPLSDLEIGSCQLLPFSGVEVSTAKFDLTLDLWDLEPGVRGALEYNTELFDQQTISRMLKHYELILNAMVVSPEQVISEFSILTEDETQQLLVDWNRTQVEYPRNRCIHELFAEQASQTPRAIALEYEGQWLTYEELDSRANQLAHYLRHLGAGPEVKIGVCMERSLDMVAALLAILKAGGAYLPLDPGYPNQRLRYMIEDSAMTLVIAQPSTAKRFVQDGVRVICLTSDRDDIAAQLCTAPTSVSTQDNLAYVIYTSGSTGLPKAVGVAHSSVLRLVCGSNFADLSGKRKFLQFAPVAFDASILEIWGCLLNGGTLVLFTASNWALADLAHFIETRSIDTAWLTAGLFHQIMETAGEKLRGLRQLLVGGDVVSPRWSRKALQNASGLVLINGYGPTENTTFTACHRMDKPQDLGPASVPIGKPVSNTQVYVLDARMQPVPAGVAGELYTGGDGLARGYLNSAPLTAEKFVPNPFSEKPGARLYRTGDLVRWTNSGNMEFLRRLDHQVKVRGYRIELGEVESALERVEGVTQAVVIARDNQFGEKQLVAYLVMSGVKNPSALREELRAELADYMIPAHFVPLEELPLTSNGKIDREALPSPASEWVRTESYVSPRTPLEKELADIWSELLGLKQVSIHDDFFQMGGHSLIAVRLRSAVLDRLKRDIPLRDLFRASTIAGLASLLEKPSERSSSTIIAEIQPRGERTPFFVVHPAGGNVFCYADLAQELGPEQPLFGLQVPAAEFLPQDTETLEQIAEVYIQAIRAVQPSGRYLLGGWSFGGLLAWEIARQLSAQGESIGMLALIDSYPLMKALDAQGAEKLPVLPWFALDLARSMGKDVNEMRDGFLQLGPEEQWETVQNALVKYGVVPRENARVETVKLVDIFTRNFRAMEKYSLRRAEQHVLLLAAAEGGNPERLTREWKQWAGGGVDFKLVPGDHYTMLKPPNVRTIAEALQCRFNDLREHAATLTASAVQAV